MSRETFLQHVRQAAQAGRAYRVHLREVPATAGYVGSDDDRCAAMATEVDEVGGSGRIVNDWNAAREALTVVLTDNHVQSALCWQHPILKELALPSLLSAHQISAHDFDSLANLEPGERRRVLLAADIGISGIDYAIAETGTLLLCSRPGQERVVSLLPPVHVAIVHEKQIVPDLIDAIDEIIRQGTQSLPSNITLITGPSKTGDIELQLTTGVHGPGKWYVIIIRNDGPQRM